MEIMTVYDNGGECLGDEYIDLSTLQSGTKEAIYQLIYLDETIDAMNDIINKHNKQTQPTQKAGG